MKYDCLIIGAGASGLIASNTLHKAGKQVLLLEARARAGGRIYTLDHPGFFRYIEAGAEFIHGNLPLTSSLLHKANIQYRPIHGEVYNIKNGTLTKHDFFNDEMELVTNALRELKTDMPFEEFMKQNFPLAKYQSLNRNLRKFIEGYNAADISRVSAQSLREEWLHDIDAVQYRPEGGYRKLIDHLLNDNIARGLVTTFSKIVAKISWQEGEVEVETTDGETYQAFKALVTVPVGVLQANSIKFIPAVPDYISASKAIGFGSVIKFIIQFREDFWHCELSGKLPSVRFIFSDAFIPTWWSQLPDKSQILTGWIGGPSVDEINPTEKSLFQMALDSLAYIFKCSPNTIKTQVTAFHIENWKEDPFTRGAYSYATVETRSAKTILTTPVSNTLYFAGEALCKGPHTGTVEAALISGEEVANEIIRSTA